MELWPLYLSPALIIALTAHNSISEALCFLQETKSAPLLQPLAPSLSDFCNEFSNICFAH